MLLVVSGASDSRAYNWRLCRGSTKGVLRVQDWSEGKMDVLILYCSLITQGGGNEHFISLQKLKVLP